VRVEHAGAIRLNRTIHPTEILLMTYAAPRCRLMQVGIYFLTC
jgi:hypothetical protein